MSLEQALAANTAALIENNALLSGLNAKAAAGKAAQAVAVTDSTPTRAVKADTKTDSKAAKAPKAPSNAEMKTFADAFVNVTDEDEYNERRAVLKAIVTFFHAPKFSELAEKDRLMAKKIVELSRAGEPVNLEDLQETIDELEGVEAPAPAAKARRSSED